MIRATTPLPRRPAAEAELLDDVLAVFRGRKSLPSSQVVRLVNQQRGMSARLPAAAVDIRLVLQPPYFRLLDSGQWRCLWELR